MCSRVAAFARKRLLVGTSTAVQPAVGFSTLRHADLPRQVLDCEYAVRGNVPTHADHLRARLKKGKSGGSAVSGEEPLGFDRLLQCNLSNPQVFGQKPLQFHRQVLACLADPSLLKAGVYAEDVVERASRYLEGIERGQVGAYSDPQGHAIFREDVARFLTERDACDADPADVFLTDGASAAVRMVLQLAVRGPADGVLLPLPQSPLYSATMSLLGGQSVGYFLDEDAGWKIDLSELERTIAEFRAVGGKPRAIVVINPGNPSGQVLSRSEIEDVLRFAEQEGLMVLADEACQDAVYTADGKPWISVRQLANELKTSVEVFSFYSAHGAAGDGGLRGGFVHLHAVDRDVQAQLRKLASLGLCSNVMGQSLVASAVVLPPVDGASRATFDSEREAIRDGLRRRAKIVADRFNSIEGMSCQPIEGAMYAFPKVIIKGYVMKKAISFATPADQIYCMELLERTGIVTVPGSGFGQKPGHFHFCLAIPPCDDDLSAVLDGIEKFHKEHPGGWFD